MSELGTRELWLGLPDEGVCTASKLGCRLFARSPMKSPLLDWVLTPVVFMSLSGIQTFVRVVASASVVQKQLHCVQSQAHVHGQGQGHEQLHPHPQAQEQVHEQ